MQLGRGSSELESDSEVVWGVWNSVAWSWAHCFEAERACVRSESLRLLAFGGGRLSAWRLSGIVMLCCGLAICYRLRAGNWD
jgi:hypothetical protein